LLIVLPTILPHTLCNAVALNVTSRGGERQSKQAFNLALEVFEAREPN